MPLYEFVCGLCKKDFELLVRSANWAGSVCPHCGSKKLTKKLSVFASQTVGPSSPSAACTSNPHSCPRCGPGHKH